MKRIFRLRLFVSPSANRKSKTCPSINSAATSKDPKSKIGGDCCSHYRVRNVWSCGHGAAANENPPDRIPNHFLTFRNAPRIDAFQQGLRELGYVEGKNIVIEWRHAEGKLDRLPALAAELVRLKVDVIVTAGPTATRPAKEATSTIPIVMTFDDDPVGNGFVASLARPGGNITGLSTLAPEISGKQLELLKEIVPRLSRVAVIGTSTRPGNEQALKEMEIAAAAFAMKVQYLDIQVPKDIETAFRAAGKERADALLVLQSPVFNAQRAQIADLALKSRLPATYPRREFVEDGGLMSYGVSISDLYRRAATYVDKNLERRQARRSARRAAD